jgi:ABC-type antimicrobial peptide transport system permease subunit
MFYLTYVTSELRRRIGRTLLTALGLGVGVGLVVAVSALSQGLNDAQDKVLEPLTGVGTDMSVTRPLRVGNRSGSSGGFGGQNLSKKERDQLQKENGGARLNLASAGKAGERFTRTSFLSTQQLSFPASEVSKVASRPGVQASAGSLTLSAITISGKVPKGGFQAGGGAGGPGGGGGGGGNPPQNINFKSLTVTGVDQRNSSLAAVTPSQVQKGSYLADDDSRQAVVNVSYAQRNNLDVGDKLTLENGDYTIVGLSRSPLGGQASDVYVKLSQLQKASGREARVNTVQVRADSANDVDRVQREIRAGFAGSSVTTSADLADRVGGSLTDAKNLSDKLGVALTVVALVAAFLIASLLTLSSVTKRIRELGTLKAIGWPQGKVVRQVTGEALAQGALGGVIGALVGIAAAGLINAVGITLKATVAGQSAGAGGLVPPGAGGGAFGQGSVTSGSTEVALSAPVDLSLILLAISLALLGGLVAGSVGGLRAARLRPADALRHIG